ncbi:diguanylate phosphodiesterase [Cronobacter sakazakii]|uniref:diguanylate phosphodiesterase n=2 Tax=Cronobacter sakazakii TaxID=28141 RepID=UPI00029C6473|nr:diguanylate phosphodiesterase [Cronobacter sakazakii]CCK03143.1 diguanylate phosphodiesterase [Cronobacter sakazakii 701]EGT0039226.1 diguanylate phosphodiesterase [Cronobacter sakazakii]EKY2037374.1 diguanylate phosphodiesterase [Cronobacter sakazakii]ELY3435769.1 diguanylate phosphodiesterase [Cronobacter sakazakii]KAB0897327.1 diguanylate phosphodiesterase [Cronobacter sakazakii]
MLSTLIYRSRLKGDIDQASLQAIVRQAQTRNAQMQVSGILVFDGHQFLQVLEGPLHAVEALFERISQDERHDFVVELMRDYAPRRHFENVGMALFDLRNVKAHAVLKAVVKSSVVPFNLSREARVYKFIRSFLRRPDSQQLSRQFQPGAWRMEPTSPPPLASVAPVVADIACQFALQPIVEPTTCKIKAYEALIRSPEGGSPAALFASLSSKALYELDLHSKEIAFALANAVNIGSQMISVNLLPGTLVQMPGAVEILLAQIARQGLLPQQVIVEVTESEVISRFDEFECVIRQLRAAGINLAIDDFGAGFAGLSLLTRFQPGRIKIDRCIVADIHLHGPKQAIVHGIVRCCAELEITVVAEGVEKVEEWCWLEAAGIRYFQGYLFARPLLNRAPSVSWPTVR